MAYSLADGVLGLEGVHQLAREQSGPVFRGHHVYSGSSPWYKIDRITGLYSLGDLDNFVQPSEGRFGEVAYPSLTRGKTITYEGRVCAPSLEKLREGHNNLRFWLMGMEGVPVFPHERGPGKRDTDISIFAESAGEGWMSYCRIMAFESDEEQTRGPTRQPTMWQREFTLTVRQYDPRFYSFPALSDDAPDDADIVVTNIGNADTQRMAITVYGPLNDLVLRNDTIDKELSFEALDIDLGERLIVSWNQRGVVRPNQAEPVNSPNISKLGNMVTIDSNWWDAFAEGIAPGANTLQVSAAPNGWKVDWQHAIW